VNLKLVLSLDVELRTKVLKKMRRNNMKVHGLEKPLIKFIFLIFRRKNKYLWKKSESLEMTEL